MLPLKDNVPTRHFPLVTVGLIATNVLFYFLYQRGGVNVPIGPVNELAFHPCEVEASCPVVGEDWPVTVFTSMFMHGDILHLGGNMLFLWIFGNNVEDALGRVRYLVWYLVAGVAATAAQTVVTLGFGNPADGAIPNLGASGAIAGVLGAYLVILPRARVLTAIFLGFIFFLQEVPAVLYLGLWFAFQLWQGGFGVVHPEAGGGVAFFAHIGGFVFGALTIHLVKARRPLRPHY
ncbi:MAG: rhomboid family intramembrane serine protease [Gaiellaceae bacterium]